MNFFMSAWFWYPIMAVAFLLTIIQVLRRGMRDDTVKMPRRIDTFNLPTATPQEVFDWVAYNLLLQGRKSQCARASGQFICAYRGLNDTRCAAGHLIADVHYDERMEGKSFTQLTMLYPQFKNIEHLENLISNLQMAHDTSEFHANSEINIWDELKRIAYIHHLDSSIVTAPV